VEKGSKGAVPGIGARRKILGKTGFYSGKKFLNGAVVALEGWVFEEKLHPMSDER
jgi:hypothetical protein